MTTCRQWERPEGLFKTLCSNEFFPVAGQGGCPVCVQQGFGSGDPCHVLTTCREWTQPDGDHFHGLCTNEFWPKAGTKGCDVCVSPVRRNKPVNCGGCNEEFPETYNLVGGEITASWPVISGVYHRSGENATFTVNEYRHVNVFEMADIKSFFNRASIHAVQPYIGSNFQCIWTKGISFGIEYQDTPCIDLPSTHPSVCGIGRNRPRLLDSFIRKQTRTSPQWFQILQGPNQTGVVKYLPSMFETGLSLYENAYVVPSFSAGVQYTSPDLGYIYEIPPITGQRWGSSTVNGLAEDGRMGGQVYPDCVTIARKAILGYVVKMVLNLSVVTVGPTKRFQLSFFLSQQNGEGGPAYRVVVNKNTGRFVCSVLPTELPSLTGPVPSMPQVGQQWLSDPITCSNKSYIKLTRVGAANLSPSVLYLQGNT